MKIVELILNEEEMASGVEAISIVEAPAIESNFVALNSQKIEFKTIDNEKRILLGPALIPNKPIYRNQELNGAVEEFYVYFSKATIEKAAQLYLMRGRQHNATLEHDGKLEGLTLVESWIKEDMTSDKSAKYGMNDPVGTWYVSMKVNNDEVWNDYVKTGKVKGFSIEGFFADKSTPLSSHKTTEQRLAEVRDILTEYLKTEH